MTRNIEFERSADGGRSTHVGGDVGHWVSDKSVNLSTLSVTVDFVSDSADGSLKTDEALEWASWSLGWITRVTAGIETSVGVAATSHDSWFDGGAVVGELELLTDG